jgi:hypothetical protein
MQLEGMTATFLQRTHAIAAILTLAPTLRHFARKREACYDFPSIAADHRNRDVRHHHDQRDRECLRVSTRPGSVRDLPASPKSARLFPQCDTDRPEPLDNASTSGSNLNRQTKTRP